MEDPAHWRERAKEMRETASSARDEYMKAIMEEIACGYERIAGHVQKIAETREGARAVRREQSSVKR